MKKPFKSSGDMVKKLLILFLFLGGLMAVASAQHIEAARINNGVFEFGDNQEQLIKAVEWTFKDGTKVTDLKVEQMQNTFFLVAYCVYQGRARMAAIDLVQEGNTFVIKEDAWFKTCSAVACETCKYFLENNRIVACKCEATGSISNHCHYRSLPVAGFITQYNRAMKMKKDQEN